MHKIAVLAFDGVVPVDLASPCEVFRRARDSAGSPVYQVMVVSERSVVKTALYDISPPSRLNVARQADTLIIPGVADHERPIPRPILETVRSAHARGSRIASICTGAFVAAAAGILDGHRATTHWIAAPALAARHPKITVDPNVLYVDEGSVVTSAGATAGLDMCLHLIRRDQGQAVAANAARLAVAPLNRDGGQAQFIPSPVALTNTSLTELLEWMSGNLNRPIATSELANRAGLAPRTFARRFYEQTGTTPLRWLQNARVRRAQELLEITTMSIDRISSAVGFESSATLRTRFRNLVGVSPMEYRRRFSAAQ